MHLARTRTERDNRRIPLMSRAPRARKRMSGVPQTMLETTERLSLFETAQAAVGMVIAELAEQAYAEETAAGGNLDRARAMRQRISELQLEYAELDYDNPVSLQATIDKHVTRRRHA